MTVDDPGAIGAAPRTPMIIDTDGGIDDAVALWWACRSAEVDLLGVSVVFGNVDLEVAARNVCRVLEAAGRTDVPVAVGAASPVGPAPSLLRADFIHGADGVGDTGRLPADCRPGDETAVRMLHRLVGERPGEVVVVTIGPMTNVAAAVEADPSWAKGVRRLVVMGGAMLAAGNAMPVSEANIAHDPQGAARSLAAAWTRPPLIVGLDVTHAATLTAAHLELADRGLTPAAADLAALLRFYARFGGTFCEPGELPCHDALAVVAAVVDGLVSGPVLPVAVETGPGPAWGMTVVDRRQPFFVRSGHHQAMPPGFAPAEVATEVDVARFRSEIEQLLGQQR